MLAASDTFRAAAIEQLENWANKVDVEITKSSQGADPASVAFKAIEEAIANNFDQVLIDTAGRLQNKKNLMEEYKKIANVTKKMDPVAKKFKLPIIALGLGEKEDDLQIFEAEKFAEAFTQIT